MNAKSLLLLIPLALLCSCGTFERKWEQSVADYRAGKVHSPEGPWVGTWTTKTNGHTGDLRAIVSRDEEKPENLEFHYHATWGKLFRGAFKVDYPATRSGSTWIVDGEEKLPLYGRFGHKARISARKFDATYSNDKGDLGNFALARPE